MIIAGTWLLFVVGSILLLLAVENGLCRSKVREKLLEQASVLEAQLPDMAENQLCYQTGSSGQIGIGRGRNGLGERDATSHDPYTGKRFKVMGAMEKTVPFTKYVIMAP